MIDSVSMIKTAIVIQLLPHKVLKAFLVIIAFLLLANVLGIVFESYLGYDIVGNLDKAFNFDAERNVPTLYAAATLVFSSILLLFIASEHRRLGQSNILWFMLSAIFLFLAIDEMLSIHERLLRPTRDLLGTSGLLYYAWVIPYSIASLIIGVIYFRFLCALPPKIKRLFLASGFIFVLGAIGFEMLCGWQAELFGKKAHLYIIFYTCEELLEMIGVAVFLYSLTLYIVSELGYSRVTISND